MWNVLVVDDEADNRALIEGILEGRASCQCVASGSEALKALSNSISDAKPYDVVLLDVAMPGIDGIQVLEQLRKMEQERGVHLGRGLPVIMVTAQQASFMKSFNGGCDDFILKPLDGDKLVSKISSKIRS